MAARRTSAILFRRSSHCAGLSLPIDWPRTNQFPEWFTADHAVECRVTDDNSGETAIVGGAKRIEGLPIELKAEVEMVNPREPYTSLCPSSQ